MEDLLISMIMTSNDGKSYLFLNPKNQSGQTVQLGLTAAITGQAQINGFGSPSSLGAISWDDGSY